MAMDIWRTDLASGVSCGRRDPPVGMDAIVL